MLEADRGTPVHRVEFLSQYRPLIIILRRLLQNEARHLLNQHTPMLELRGVLVFRIQDAASLVGYGLGLGS